MMEPEYPRVKKYYRLADKMPKEDRERYENILLKITYFDLLKEFEELNELLKKYQE